MPTWKIILIFLRLAWALWSFLSDMKRTVRVKRGRAEARMLGNSMMVLSEGISRYHEWSNLDTFAWGHQLRRDMDDFRLMRNARRRKRKGP